MLTVIHKGTHYNFFDSIGVNTSLDDICGEFQIATTLSKRPPFNKGDFVVIQADGNNICSGFIEKVSGEITSTSSNVVFSGRDLLGDLVDSSLPIEASVTEGSISLPDLCTKVINALGIKSKVKNLVGYIKPFDEGEISAIKFEGKAGKYLQDFARKRSLYLNTDGNGYLVIFTPPKTSIYKEKLTYKSMLSRSFSFSDTERFNKIEVGGEANFSILNIGNLNFSDSVDQKQIFIDKAIRSTRYLQIQPDVSMDDSELEGKAKEEANIRRARGFEFSCVVPSHRYLLGKLIQIEDKISGVSGIFLIRKVSYQTTLQGNTSQLTVCFPETYTGAGNRTTTRKSEMDIKETETIPRTPSIFEQIIDEEFSRYDNA